MRTILVLIISFLTPFAYLDANTNNIQQEKLQIPQEIKVSFPTIPQEKNNAEAIRDWILAITAIGSLITISVGSWKSLKEYRLKVIAEARVSAAAKIEADINLVKHFTEIMEIAHSRGGYQLSETTIEKLFDEKVFSQSDFKDLKQLNQKIKEASLIYLPVGVAAQDSAICAIAELAIRHDILRKPAIQALESMKSFKKDPAEKYLNEIEEKTSQI